MILQNVTTSVVTFILYKTASDELMSSYQSRRHSRNNRVFVKIDPNSRTDLVADWGMTPEELKGQPELQRMLTAGYVRELKDSELGIVFVDPKPLLTAEDLLRHRQLPVLVVHPPDEPTPSLLDSSVEPPPVIDRLDVVDDLKVEAQPELKTAPAPAVLSGPAKCPCGREFKNDKGLQLHQKFCNAAP
jgi:hypothetical protein